MMLLYWALPYIVVGGALSHIGDRTNAKNGEPLFDKYELAFVIGLWPLVMYWMAEEWIRGDDDN